MTDAEVIVVGGGPGGSSCAWRLREAGIEAIVLDKQDFPRAKPCAGWITPRVFRDLRLDVPSYPHSLVRFDRLHFHFHGRALPLPTRQHAIRRIEFDHWLLERAGVPVHHHAITHIRKQDGYYILEDTYRCKYLVGAGGTHCPVYRAFFREANPRPYDSQITAMEVEFPSESQGRGCHLWFSRELPGYAWYVPKGNGYLNIGVGGKSHVMEAQGRTIRNYWDDMIRKLGDLSFLTNPPAAPQGYVYYLRGGTGTVQLDNVYIVGDAAGLATRDMGEGIGPAVRSGILAAEAIIHGTKYSAVRVPKYSLVDLIFPRSPRNPAFAR